MEPFLRSNPDMEEPLAELIVRNGSAAAKMRGLGHAKLLKAGLSDGTANRLTGKRPEGEKKRQNMTLDVVEKVAAAVKFPAWMLLMSEFDPDDPPIVTRRKGRDMELQTLALEMAVKIVKEMRRLGIENIETAAAGIGGVPIDSEPDERGRTQSRAAAKAAGKRKKGPVTKVRRTVKA